MVRICIISTHSFHQTALLLLLGVSLCSHLSYVPPHLTKYLCTTAALLSPLQSHADIPFCFGLVCVLFKEKPMFILPHGDIYLATFRARLAGPSSQNCRRWEPSANPGGRCYERKKRKGKPLSSRQTWELLHISPPQGRQAAPMRWELLRD